MKIAVSSIGWDLVELEQAAHLVAAEEKEGRQSTNPIGFSNSQGASEALHETSEATMEDVKELEPSPSMGAHTSDHMSAATCECCREQSVARLEPTVQALSVGLEKLLTLNPSAKNSDLSCVCSTPLIEELHQQSDTTDSDSSSDSNSLSSDSESSESDSQPAHHADCCKT